MMSFLPPPHLTRCVPSYLRLLVTVMCSRGIFEDVAHEVDSIGSTLPLLLAHDLLPSLERDHNALGVPYALPRTGGGPRTQGSAERVLKLLLAFGPRGFTDADVQECLSEPVPDNQRIPIMRAIAPLLHRGRLFGQVRYALTCPYTVDAITRRFWPSAMVFRGTGCNQLTHKLPPARPPTHLAFGKHPGVHPLFVFEVSNLRNLRLIRRLLARLVSLHTVRGQGKDGKEVGQKLLSLNVIVLGAEDVLRLAPAMLEVDDRGDCVNKFLEWLARLDPPVSEAEEEGARGEEGQEGGKPKKNKGRPGWTSAMEVLSSAGKGCDAVHWITDSPPTQVRVAVAGHFLACWSGLVQRPWTKCTARACALLSLPQRLLGVSRVVPTT